MRRPAATTTPSRATRARPRHAEPSATAREYRDDEASHDADELVPRTTQPSYQITTLHPRTYNEARTIGEHFRKSTPVIMNLSEMDDADAKRLVDFAAGLTFGLHGRIERVTAKVFLLSPHNVRSPRRTRPDREAASSTRAELAASPALLRRRPGTHCVPGRCLACRRCWRSTSGGARARLGSAEEDRR